MAKLKNPWWRGYRLDLVGLPRSNLTTITTRITIRWWHPHMWFMLVCGFARSILGLPSPAKERKGPNGEAIEAYVDGHQPPPRPEVSGAAKAVRERYRKTLDRLSDTPPPPERPKAPLSSNIPEGSDKHRDPK